MRSVLGDGPASCISLDSSGAIVDRLDSSVEPQGEGTGPAENSGDEGRTCSGCFTFVSVRKLGTA